MAPHKQELAEEEKTRQQEQEQEEAAKESGPAASQQQAASPAPPAAKEAGPAASQQQAAEGAVVLLDSSEEEGPKPGQEGEDLGLSKEAEDLKAAFALLKKAQAAYKKKEAQLSPARLQQPAQASLETFWSPEKVQEPPGLQDVSAAQTPNRSPYWLVAAQQEVPVLAVKEEALVKAALEGPEPGTLVKKQRKPGSGRPSLGEEAEKARRQEKDRQEEEKKGRRCT